jgi:hypothetical protein
MPLSLYILPGREDPVELEGLADRATELLRGYLRAVPMDRLVDLSSGLAAEAQEVLSERAQLASIVLGGIGAPVERWGATEEPAAIAFSVEPGGGGGVARSGQSDDPDAREAIDLARAAALERKEQGLLDQRLALGRRFVVERTLGQPPLAVLAHGLLAAALAEAVDGLVVDADDVWDAGLWPCTGAELAAAFLRPERALAEPHRRQAEAMLREVAPALCPFDARFVGRVLDEIVAGLVADVNAVRGDEPAELAAFDRALDRLDTVRLLGAGSTPHERDLLLGPGAAASPRGSPSAFARLHPTPDEYERWVAHLGELLA